MKVKKFLKRIVATIILILFIVITCHVYVTNFLLAPIKTGNLSNAEQVSILRGEMQDIKTYLDSVVMEIYALQQESVAQAKYIQGMLDEKAEHEAQLKEENEANIKSNREHDIIWEHEELRKQDKALGLKESVIVFTATALKGIKDKLWGWGVNSGF